MRIAFKSSWDAEASLCMSYLVSYLVRSAYTKILLNNLKCQSFLGFKTAVSKMFFVLMGNSKLSLEECTKLVYFLKLRLCLWISLMKRAVCADGILF